MSNRETKGEERKKERKKEMDVYGKIMVFMITVENMMMPKL